MKNSIKTALLTLGLVASVTALADIPGGKALVKHPVYLKKDSVSCAYDPNTNVSYILADFQNGVGVVDLSVQDMKKSTAQNPVFLNKKAIFLAGGSVLEQISGLPEKGTVLTVQGRDANKQPLGNAVTYTYDGTCVRM